MGRISISGMATTLAFGAAACDPGFTMELRQPLRPAPQAACVARTLAATRFVESATPVGEERFSLVLRDSAGRSWTPMLELSRPRRDSARVASVTYVYLLLSRPARSQEPGMVAAAAAVLGELRAACSPSSAPAVACTTIGAAVPACNAIGRAAPARRDGARP